MHETAVRGFPKGIESDEPVPHLNSLRARQTSYKPAHGRDRQLPQAIALRRQPFLEPPVMDSDPIEKISSVDFCRSPKIIGLRCCCKALKGRHVDGDRLWIDCKAAAL